jgi:hypothetical protein
MQIIRNGAGGFEVRPPTAGGPGDPPPIYPRDTLTWHNDSNYPCRVSGFNPPVMQPAELTIQAHQTGSSQVMNVPVHTGGIAVDYQVGPPQVGQLEVVGGPIIIVDPPPVDDDEDHKSKRKSKGVAGRKVKSKSTARSKSKSAGKAKPKAKSKAKAKPKAKAKSKTKTKAKPKAKGKAKPKAMSKGRRGKRR